MEFTAQQQAGIEKAVDWHKNSDEQVFRLFGYAGTGKTTIANSIVEELNLSGRALFAAFTGKAAYVLRTKGALGASTIHSLIYQAKEKTRATINELYRKLERETDPAEQTVIERTIRVEEAKLAQPDWILKEDSELADALLLVLDEVSMVGHTIAADLLSFGTKLLVLGDPAQLPPVESDGGYFINAAPNHLLDEIHRSALDSPVTRLATAVRNAPHGDRALGVPDPDDGNGRVPYLDPRTLPEYQVIVGTNRSRWRYNELLRALRGLDGTTPQPADKIICLVNNPTNEAFNGQQFTVVDCTPHRDYSDVLHLEVLDDENHLRGIDAWASGFVDTDGETQAKRNGRGKVAACTWGWAITCHKSQGSQWDRVCVVDESQVFARMRYREHVEVLGRDGASLEAHIAAKQWAYTAITRAAERVVILGGGR